MKYKYSKLSDFLEEVFVARLQLATYTAIAEDLSESERCEFVDLFENLLHLLLYFTNVYYEEDSLSRLIRKDLSLKTIIIQDFKQWIKRLNYISPIGNPLNPSLKILRNNSIMDILPFLIKEVYLHTKDYEITTNHFDKRYYLVPEKQKSKYRWLP